jgi:multisubunit Na+/H+ antiporter MnhB subunit
VARGLVGGMVAAASLIGLLLGMGRRTGTAFRPLNATAHMLLGTRADDVWGFNSVVTIVGVLVVLALSAMTGSSSRGSHHRSARSAHSSRRREWRSLATSSTST